MGALIYSAVGNVSKASKDLFSKSPLIDVFKATAPYTLLDKSICPLHVLVTRSECLSPSSQQKELVVAGGPLRGEERVGLVAFDQLADTDDEQCNVTYPTFDRLHPLILD